LIYILLLLDTPCCFTPIPVVYGVGLRPLVVWDRGSASCCGQDLCQVEVYGTGLSLVQRSPTEHGVCNCETEASTMNRL